MNQLRWDTFICHASEDKETVARPLANHLANHRLRVWLDEGQILPGQSIREKIDEGLTQSRFGVVVFSASFLKKAWTKSELGGIFAREATGKNVLVPVWHEVSHADVVSLSPLIADRLALDTSSGLSHVARSIATLLRREAVSYRPGMPIFAGRLTKAKLLELPEGSYLMSNIVNNDLTPKISQVMLLRADREALWASIKADGLSTSKFYVFSSAAEFREHISAREVWTKRDA